MNAKRKGTRNERKTRRWLEALGYSCMRAAGSLGEWDLVAIGPVDVRLVQVKSNANPGSVEMEGLRMFTVPPGVRKEVWRWNDYAREPRVVVV